MNKKSMAILLAVFCLTSYQGQAQKLGQSFPPGAGAAYKILFKKETTPVYLSLYITGARVDSVHIEYFMETKSLVPIQMWQQFEIGISNKGSEIRKGFIQTKDLAQAEIIPAEYLKGSQGGIQLNDFIFSSKEQLAKNKMGDEVVEVSAGSTKAAHYRTQNNGQTIDYWISDEAKPLGLVMLISKSATNDNQNYSLELLNMMENVKAKIIPEKAVPITSKGKEFLVRPESVR